MSGRDDRSVSRRATLKAGGAAIATIGLAGCIGRAGTTLPLDPPSRAAIETGGIFTIGIHEPPAGTNPLTVTAEESFAITDLLNGFGTAVDPIDFGVHPSAYTKWGEFKTETPDATPAVQFNVRGDLEFTDDTACTVEDVLFTYRYLLEHRPKKFASVLEPIESVARSPSYRWDFRMELAHEVGVYDSEQLAVPILPKHVWKDIDNPATYEPTEHGGPVGLGPAELETYRPDEAIELDFRDEYSLSDLDWIRQKKDLLDGGPFLDGVRYRVYEDSEALKEAFRKGEIDSVYGSFPADEVESILENEGRTTVRGSDDAYKAFEFNLRKTPLDDLPFRQVFGFAFDDQRWLELNDGHVTTGDFVVPPGYTAVRPEHQPSIIPRPNQPAGQHLLTGPSTNAFAFRAARADSRTVDVAGIRSFLTSRTLIDGDSGTFVGQKYPGSLTSASASQTEPKYEYSFGSVESDVLEDAPTEKEVRVDGNTITAINGGPLVIFSRPAKEKPAEATMTRRYVKALRRIGIPVERTAIESKKLRKRVFRREDFDVTPVDATPVSEFAIGSLYQRFHSDNADNHSTAAIGERKNTTRFLRNSMGYGLDDAASADGLIEEARHEMSVESRNDLIRKATERIYLDFPLMVVSYDTLYWPARTDAFDGFVKNIPAPGDTYLPTQLVQLHRS